MARPWLALVASLAFVGCRSVDWEASGDNYVRQGNQQAALDAYKRADPAKSSPELSGKIQKTTDTLVEKFVNDAQTALDDGKFDDAIAKARAGREVRADERFREIEATAKRRLVERSTEHARALIARGEFAEAIERLEAARRHDDSPAIADLLAQAKRGAAQALVAQARQQAAAGDYDAAVASVRQSLALHDLPATRGVLAEVERARNAANEQRFDAHIAAAERARAAGDWGRGCSEAEAALRLASKEPATSLAAYCRAMAAGDAAVAREDYADAGKQYTLAVESGRDDGAATERQGQLAGKRAELVAEASRLVSERAWARATIALKRARAVRDGDDVTRLLRYVTGMAEGEEAAARADWIDAEARFRDAAGAGLDDGGYAAGRQSAVRVTTWRISLTSVTTTPLKKDESVWDGSLTKAIALEKLQAAIGRAKNGEEAAQAMSLAIREANRPDPFTVVTLPDGRKFRCAAAENEFQITPGVAFTVTGNQASEEIVEFAVYDADPDGAEELVGRLPVKVGELLLRGPRTGWQFGQVHEMVLALEDLGPQADGGCVERADEVPDATERNEATTRSQAKPGRRGFRIFLRRLLVAGEEHGAAGEAREGAIEIRQGKDVVFRSGTQKCGEDKQWPGDDAPRTWLFVDPKEELEVRLVSGEGKPFTFTTSVETLASGAVAVTTPKGSAIEIEAKARGGFGRKVGPADDGRGPDRDDGRRDSGRERSSGK